MKNSIKYLSCMFLLLFLFSVGAMIFALVSTRISNLTLVFYSMSVPCAWKISSLLGWQGGIFATHKKKKIISISIIIFMCFYVAITILSLYSCVMLFPHPYIHRYLIGAIYLVGFSSTLYILYIAVCIRWQKFPSYLIVRQKIQTSYNNLSDVRKKYLNTFSENLSLKFMELSKENNNFFIFNAKKFLFKRIRDISLYIAIFMWIFVVIPARTLDEISIFYKILFTVVTGGCLANILLTIVKTYKSCKVYKYGISVKSLFGVTHIFWEQIENIIITDVELIISCFGKPKKIIIAFQNIPQDIEFLESFFKQGELLFTKKSAKNWDQMDFLLNIFKQAKRKIEKDALIEKIQDDKLCFYNKEEIFYVVKSEKKIKVFQGKLPLDIYFVLEPFWKQLHKFTNKEKNKYLDQFIKEYKGRLSI